jgi:hypothetical protein
VLPIIVAVVLVGVVVAVVLARRATQKATARVEQRLAGLDVLRRSKANLYGIASEGGGQVRGLGVLALTPDELLFVQFVPDRQVRVRRDTITGAQPARSFLGKTQGRDLLVVTWDADVAAWDVPDVAAWQAALRK